MYNRRFLFSSSGNGERLKFYPNMKAIIAEKQSVGMDIARVVGATDKKDGYCTGNGYMVTWVPVPSGRQADQDGQGDGAGHGRLPATESHRRGVLQM